MHRKISLNKTKHAVEYGMADVGEIMNDLNVGRFAASLIRDVLDEMKNVVYRKRSSLHGTCSDGGQTMTLLTRNDKKRNDLAATKTTKNFSVDLNNGEVESYDCNVAASVIF